MFKKVTTILAAGAIASCAIGVAAPAPANAAQTLFCNYTNTQYNLYYGDTGIVVKQAQCEIKFTIHTSIATDGVFGPATLAAVKQVQSCAHILVDGKIGPDTWKVINYWSNRSGWLC